MRESDRRSEWVPRFLVTALALAVALANAPAVADDLTSLSLEALMDIEVTSVSKRAEKLSEAAAAITVITGEQLRRSGFRSIPEALRMVPGLDVARIDANKWAISSRGFNGRFANKLLVMIDGRSVYTPAFSGVYWEFQDTMIEDVDRIEVIRGPGGTLWGANAVNGVINIITKPAAETQGMLVSVGGGTHELFGASRYGGELGEGVHYRAYTRGFGMADYDSPTGGDAHDGWNAGRGGFRLDWETGDQDNVTFQGDYFDGEADQTNQNPLIGRDTADFRGGNLLARWSHTVSERSGTQTQLYWDRYQRDEGFVGETRDTLDFDFQHDLTLSVRHELIWGLNYRLTTDDIDNTGFTRLQPSSQTDHLVAGFVQSQYELVENQLVATLGTKLEYNEYSGFEVQPSARLLYTPHANHTFWGAISRAVRTPARIDHGISIVTPLDAFTIANFVGDTDFAAEDLISYELGYRAVLRPDLTVDAAAFISDYNNLRSFEQGTPIPAAIVMGIPVPPFTVPLTFDNQVEAHSRGFELEAAWQPRDFWSLTLGYSYLHLNNIRDGASSDPLSENAEDDNPSHQVQLRSRLDLPRNFELDSAVYWVDAASNQGAGSYWRGDLRLGWRPRDGLDLSLVGQNLFDHGHQEFNDLFSVGSSVPRTFYAMVTWSR